MKRWTARFFATLAMAGAGLWSAELPAGYPSRAADLNVLPGFKMPPAGYGEVSFYWWLGMDLPGRQGL